jgi:hypothetical protein
MKADKVIPSYPKCNDCSNSTGFYLIHVGSYSFYLCKLCIAVWISELSILVNEKQP